MLGTLCTLKYLLSGGGSYSMTDGVECYSRIKECQRPFDKVLQHFSWNSSLTQGTPGGIISLWSIGYSPTKINMLQPRCAASGLLHINWDGAEHTAGLRILALKFPISLISGPAYRTELGPTQGCLILVTWAGLYKSRNFFLNPHSAHPQKCFRCHFIRPCFFFFWKLFLKNKLLEVGISWSPFRGQETPPDSQSFPPQLPVDVISKCF